jgi:hypothetical protein
MLLITVSSGIFDGLFGGIALLIVSLSFIYLPIEYLSYHQEPLDQYGLYEGGFGHPLGYKDAMKKALLISLIVFPIYGLAYHAVMSYQNIKAKWTWQSLTRWSEDLRDEPIDIHVNQGDILVYAIQDQLDIVWKLKENEKSISFEFAHIDKNDIKLRYSSQKVDMKKTALGVQIQAKTIGIAPKRHQKISFKYTANHLDLQMKIDQKSVEAGRIETGALKKSSDAHIEEKKSLHWLWQILLIQLFLVAFPEEIFYRGYLQSKLDRLIGQDSKILGVSFNLISALICSILFAFAHLATIHHLSRLSVFFPSLLFGWMRRAYVSVVPVAIFHALCNLYSQLLWGIYH